MYQIHSSLFEMSACDCCECRKSGNLTLVREKLAKLWFAVMSYCSFDSHKISIM